MQHKVNKSEHNPHLARVRVIPVQYTFYLSRYCAGSGSSTKEGESPPFLSPPQLCTTITKYRTPIALHRSVSQFRSCCVCVACLLACGRCCCLLLAVFLVLFGFYCSITSHHSTCTLHALHCTALACLCCAVFYFGDRVGR